MKKLAVRNKKEDLQVPQKKEARAAGGDSLPPINLAGGLNMPPSTVTGGLGAPILETGKEGLKYDPWGLDSGKVCRICLDDEDANDPGENPFITPCGC